MAVVLYDLRLYSSSSGGGRVVGLCNHLCAAAVDRTTSRADERPRLLHEALRRRLHQLTDALLRRRPRTRRPRGRRTARLRLDRAAAARRSALVHRRQDGDRRRDRHGRGGSGRRLGVERRRRGRGLEWGRAAGVDRGTGEAVARLRDAAAARG